MSTQFELPSNFTNATPVLTYRAPFSSHPADNAIQGKITNGVLHKTFEAPKERLTAVDTDSSVYRNRIEQRAGAMNPVVAKRAANIEKFKAMPGMKGSEVVTEAFTEEQSHTLIILLLSLIAICILGCCFGILSLRTRTAYRPIAEEYTPSVAAQSVPSVPVYRVPSVSSKQINTGVLDGEAF